VEKKAGSKTVEAINLKQYLRHRNDILGGKPESIECQLWETDKSDHG
jgi:hypothetical protein